MKSGGIGLVLLGMLAGCGGQPKEQHDEHQHAESEGHEVSAEPGMVRIDPEMLRDLRISTAKAESRSGREGTSLLGELSANQNTYAEVGTPVTARVLRIMCAPGDHVRAGAALADLQSADLGRSRANYLSAAARAELARQSLSRKEGLAAARIAPQREVEEARSEVAAAEAELTAARAALSVYGATEPTSGKTDANFTLRSPIAGTILERSILRGQMVSSEETLFKIGDLSKVWLTAHAFERDALRIPLGAQARVGFAALPGQSFMGTIALVGAQVDPSSRTIPIRIEVANSTGQLRPGMSATAWVPLGEASEKIVAVPAASLQRLHEGWCVFLPHGEGLFEARTVGRGRDLSGEIEILSGLKAGESVVVDGAFLLKAEAEKSRGEGGHHHD